MNFLLDTNLVSEWTKPRPNPGVVAWLAEVDEDRTFLSAITFVELRYGINRLPAGKRRLQLDEWATRVLPLRFENRILAIDALTSDLCGQIMASSESMGRRMDFADAFLAATAQLHGLTVVTRNLTDFEPVLNTLFSPWI